MPGAEPAGGCCEWVLRVGGAEQLRVPGGPRPLSLPCPFRCPCFHRRLLGNKNTRPLLLVHPAASLPVRAALREQQRACVTVSNEEPGRRPLSVTQGWFRVRLRSREVGVRRLVLFGKAVVCRLGKSPSGFGVWRKCPDGAASLPDCLSADPEGRRSGPRLPSHMKDTELKGSPPSLVRLVTQSQVCT